MGKPMARSELEDRLEAITRQFVREIVAALRSASFADVAQLQVNDGARARPRGRPPTRVSASPSPRNSTPGERKACAGTPDGRPTRRAGGTGAESAREEAGQSLGVRALSSELGVAPDLLLPRRSSSFARPAESPNTARSAR